MRHFIFLLAFAAVVPCHAFADAESESGIKSSQVVELIRFLEDNPRHADAPALRRVLMRWEDKTEDTEDMLCEGVTAPVPSKNVPNGPELLGQFILGSAAFQLANPAQKGALQPSQLAGMRSMLKVYRIFLRDDPKARIPRFDELSAKEADGSLAAYLEPLVASACKPQ